MALRDLFVVREESGPKFTQPPLQGKVFGRADVLTRPGSVAAAGAPAAATAEEVVAALKKISDPNTRQQFKDAFLALSRKRGTPAEWKRLLDLARAEWR